MRNIFNHMESSEKSIDTFLCKKIEEGTRIRVKFNTGYDRRGITVEGILKYMPWANDSLYPFLIDLSGSSEVILDADVVEIME